MVSLRLADGRLIDVKDLPEGTLGLQKPDGTVSFDDYWAEYERTCAEATGEEETEEFLKEQHVSFLLTKLKPLFKDTR